MPIINLNQYPMNYDDYSEKFQNNILSMFRYEVKLAEEERKSGNKDNYHRIWDQINNAQKMMHTMGLMVEYNWVGHREDWVLATYDMAVQQEEYYLDMREG